MFSLRPRVQLLLQICLWKQLWEAYTWPCYSFGNSEQQNYHLFLSFPYVKWLIKNYYLRSLARQVCFFFVTFNTALYFLGICNYFYCQGVVSAPTSCLAFYHFHLRSFFLEGITAQTCIYCALNAAQCVVISTPKSNTTSVTLPSKSIYLSIKAFSWYYLML